MVSEYTPLQQASLGGAPRPAPDIAAPRSLDDPFVFLYADSRHPGVTIAESLAVDMVSASFSWTRTSTAAAAAAGVAADASSEIVKPAAKRRSNKSTGGIAELGGRWCAEDVAGVRFVTKRGDPSTEHLTLSQKRLVRRLAFQKWLRDRGIDLSHGFLIFVNPLTLALALSLLLTGCMWDVFPRVDGKYMSSVARESRTLRSGWNMMAPPDEPALDWSACVAAGTLLVTLFACWWVGLVPVRGCRCATALPPKVTNRWVFLKPINGLILGPLVIWCIAVVVICPLAKFASSVEQCSPIANDGRRLEAPIYDGDPQCYQQDGMKLRCGVGNCTCGWQKDLACGTPPPMPKETCQTLRRPLCAPDSSAVETNGYHGHLLVLAIGSSVFSALLFLDCLLNGFAMLQEWFPPRSSKVQDAPLDDVRPQVIYHRFTVSFTLPEKNLEFNISGQDDARVLAAMLLGGTPPDSFASPLTPPMPPMPPDSRPISSDSASKSLGGPASTAAPEDDDEQLVPVDC